MGLHINIVVLCLLKSVYVGNQVYNASRKKETKSIVYTTLTNSHVSV